MNMVSDIRITDSASVASIDVEGVIGVPEQVQFGGPDERVATYARFASSLAALKGLKAKEVVVNIRSTGGDVNDALLIYDALRELDARITTRCFGYVASAATIIAQAASRGCREISSNALYLIHCCESAAEGNSQTLSATKELLDRTDERIAAIYAQRGGRPAEGYMALMSENGGRGRWITADEAVGAGLADRVIGPAVNNRVGGRLRDEEELRALCRLFGLTPPPPDNSRTDPKDSEGGRGKVLGSLRKVLRRLLGGGWFRNGDTGFAAGSDVPDTLNDPRGCGEDSSQGDFSEGDILPAPTSMREETDVRAEGISEEGNMQKGMILRVTGGSGNIDTKEVATVGSVADSAEIGLERGEYEEAEERVTTRGTGMVLSEKLGTEISDGEGAESFAGDEEEADDKPIDVAGEIGIEKEPDTFGEETGIVTAGNPSCSASIPSGELYPTGERAEGNLSGSCGEAIPRAAASLSSRAEHAIAAWRKAQTEAYPTTVKTIEDPSVEERNPSPNEQAYYQDALSLRCRT